MKSILKRFVHLLMTLALILALLPVRALAVETDPGWTQYGKAGHATASGDTVSFSGDPKIPFTALLFRAAEDGDYRKFTFHLSEGNSDWHTLEGSGFVFNACIADHALTGYAVLFGQNSVGYYKLSNVPTSLMQNTQFTKLPGVSLIQQVAKPSFSSGTTWYLELLVSPGSMSFYKHDSPAFDGASETIFSNVEIDDSIGSGYGPFGSFISHDCAIISNSSFEYFTLTISPNTPPQITAPDITIRRGESFDPLEGLAAHDAEDGDVSSAIQIVANPVNTAVPGIYAVEYSVADILGLIGTRTRIVTVLADADFYVVDSINGEAIPGVGLALNGGTELDLEDTDERGRTSTILAPGDYAWSIRKPHPDYIVPADGMVRIDADHFASWPAQVRIELEKKIYDMALDIQLTQLNGEAATDKTTAQYHDLITYTLLVTNKGNQAALPILDIKATAGLSAVKETAALLSDGRLGIQEALQPGECAPVELTFRVLNAEDAAIEQLQAGITQIIAEDGSEKADRNPADNQGQATATVRNPPILLTVYDAQKPDVKLADAELVVKDQDGKTVATGTSDEKGEILLHSLLPGEYAITQTKVTPGYQLPKGGWSFVKATDGKITGTTKIPNEPTVVELQNIELLAEGEEKLLGAAEVVILDSAGQTVAAGTVSAEGFLRFQGLKPGRYVLKQTKAPAGGYALQAKEYPFTISESGATSGDLKIVNAPTRVEIAKTDPEQQPVQGATYEIYNDQNERVFEGRTDKEGKLVVTHLKAGKYSYRESKAPSRYALDTTAYTFEVDETGGVTGDLAVSDPFTSIVIQKVDGKTGKPLMGAKFGLYDQSDKLVDSLVSDRDGLVAFSKIAQGSYKIRELQPPEGYAANGKLITVNITETYVNPTEPYVVENAPQPQTGVSGFPWWIICLIAVCALGAGGCGYLLLTKERFQKQSEK